MSILNVYKSRLPSVNYIFRNGKPAIFVEGKFCTDIEAEVKELEEEIAAGHPHIFVDAAEKTIDSNAVSPLEALREKIRQELMEEMARATDPNNDMGKSDPEKLKVATSTDIAQAAQGGSGMGLAARLMKVASTTGTPAAPAAPTV